MHLKECHVLIVEDDREVAKHTCELLEIFCAQVDHCVCAHEAWEAFEAKHHPIVVLDIELPDMNGLDLAHKIRTYAQKTQIIVFTSFVKIDYLKKAIPLGLVAYLEKPVNYQTFHDTLNQVAKNIEEIQCAILQLHPNVQLNLHTFVLYNHNTQHLLSVKEVSFLETLAKERGSVISKKSILEELWGDEIGSEAALRNLVLRLRKKLEPYDILKNYRGYGYALVN